MNGMRRLFGKGEEGLAASGTNTLGKCCIALSPRKPFGKQVVIVSHAACNATLILIGIDNM
jgi:hypothetical protein